MGVIGDRELQRRIKEEALITGGEFKLQACSVDLSIGTIFRDGQVINGEHESGRKQIIVKPGEVVSMLTGEQLSLPKDVCGFAFPINSQGSDGLLVLNPGHIDPGFIGSLCVRAVNLRKVDLALSLGAPIFTVVFFKLDQFVDAPYSTNLDRRTRELRINKEDVET